MQAYLILYFTGDHQGMRPLSTGLKWWSPSPFDEQHTADNIAIWIQYHPRDLLSGLLFGLWTAIKYSGKCNLYMRNFQVLSTGWE